MVTVKTFACLFTSQSPNNESNVTSMALQHSALFCQKARTFAAISASSSIGPQSVGSYQVFDRNFKRIQKDRAAFIESGKRSRTVDYVRDEVAERMLERFLV